MQIQQISKQQIPGFKARVEIIGNAQKLLPKNSVKRLQSLAKTFGTDDDVIFIGMTQHAEYGIKESRGFLGLKEEHRYIKSLNTQLSMSHCCPGINSFKILEEEKLIPWKASKPGIFTRSFEINKMAAYKAIYKYIDKIKAKFS